MALFSRRKKSDDRVQPDEATAEVEPAATPDEAADGDSQASAETTNAATRRSAPIDVLA